MRDEPKYGIVYATITSLMVAYMSLSMRSAVADTLPSNARRSLENLGRM